MFCCFITGDVKHVAIWMFCCFITGDVPYGCVVVLVWCHARRYKVRLVVSTNSGMPTLAILCGSSSKVSDILRMAYPNSITSSASGFNEFVIVFWKLFRLWILFYDVVQASSY
jgi:hypothetical protein